MRDSLASLPRRCNKQREYWWSCLLVWCPSFTAQAQTGPTWFVTKPQTGDWTPLQSPSYEIAPAISRDTQKWRWGHRVQVHLCCKKPQGCFGVFISLLSSNAGNESTKYNAGNDGPRLSPRKGWVFLYKFTSKVSFPFEKNPSVPAYYFRQKSRRGPSKRSAKSYVAAQKWSGNILREEHLLIVRPLHAASNAIISLILNPRFQSKASHSMQSPPI